VCGIECREEAVNGKQDMMGQRHWGEGLFEFWGKEALFDFRDCIFWVGVWVDCYRGASVVGSFGLGAKNPHGNLELGSQIGFVPSWQGGKIWFWAEFGQSSSEDKRRLEK
jgi:hypothetical protein